MADHLSPEARSANMGRVKGANTGPEVQVRKIAHRLGLRFRLHRRDLPGTPDLVLPRHKVAIFVHGCFWHRHKGCSRATTPKTRETFWLAKFEATVRRDAQHEVALIALGWRVLTIWECEIKDRQLIEQRLIISAQNVKQEDKCITMP
ncbi:very short patch repair endonuclease [Sphingomonas jatrophae]|uniref:Very short patch repair endonuclease n=1 Tax=Sphingomonas jatrophae TaxID=1166337 RepID=A0A1I6JRG1_9SPHN|nr:very short patch repair endonuclease [Sphingomonas jatrophae]SFR81565.1 T/G mismatch-specific endonuclease [Sphingomonas jatrophae]